MIEFKCQHKDARGYILETIVMTGTEHASLIDVVEQFERFLRASGYSFDGTLDFVPIDDGDILPFVDNGE